MVLIKEKEQQCGCNHQLYYVSIRFIGLCRYGFARLDPLPLGYTNNFCLHIPKTMSSQSQTKSFGFSPSPPKRGLLETQRLEVQASEEAVLRSSHEARAAAGLTRNTERCREVWESRQLFYVTLGEARVFRIFLICQMG